MAEHYGAVAETSGGITRIVVLDVRKDRFFLRDPVQVGPDAVYRPRLPPPDRDICLESKRRSLEGPRAGDVFLAVLCLILAIALRRSPLRVLLRTLRSMGRRGCGTPVAPNDLLEVTAALRTAKRLLPVTVGCLTWSTAHVLLGRIRRMDVSMVVGVRTAPFYAHAWAQAGSTVINDELDEVREYSVLLEVP